MDKNVEFHFYLLRNMLEEAREDQKLDLISKVPDTSVLDSHHI